MEVTIVQNMPIPRAKNGRAGSGSRYNAIIDQVSAGDCVQFKERAEGTEYSEGADDLEVRKSPGQGDYGKVKD